VAGGLSCGHGGGVRDDDAGALPARRPPVLT
jgi:hypothetical protein